MNLILYTSALFIVLLLTQEMFRRLPRFTLGFFAMVPFFLTLYWKEIGVSDWFTWGKMFLVNIGVIWFSVFRLTKFSENMFAKVGVYLILVANISEAVLVDIFSGGMAHNLNAIAGIFLIITLNKINSINTIKDKYLDVSWDGMTMMWILGYTIWNLSFIYLNFSRFFIENIAVLGVPLAIAFFNRGRWLQTRALTLSIYLILLYPSFKLWPRINSHFWINDSGGNGFAMISLIFMIVYTIIFLRSKRACG